MPREVELMGFYMPTLLPLFIAAATLLWLIDPLLGRLGIYRGVWHPALFRLSLFVCLFGLPALWLYR
jgi:hypothetical protein